MKNASKIAFVVLSVLLSFALIWALAAVYKSNTSTEEAPAAAVAVYSVPEISPYSFEEEFSSATERFGYPDESVDESDEDPSPSSDISYVSPVVSGGGKDPIVIAKDDLEPSELDAFFNDSLWVGHSVMVHFSGYVSGWRQAVDKGVMGDAIFACASSFSFNNNKVLKPDDPRKIFPQYRGSFHNIQGLPGAAERGTLYLSLMGLNDLGMRGDADTCSRLIADLVEEVIDELEERYPDLKIVVLATTYMTRDKVQRNLNNLNLSRLNQYVLDYCNGKGLDFIDVASPLRDEGGYLASVYSSDAYCHLTKKAYHIWMDVLRDYASRKISGTWQNPTGIELFPE